VTTNFTETHILHPLFLYHDEDIKADDVLFVGYGWDFFNLAEHGKVVSVLASSDLLSSTISVVNIFKTWGIFCS